MHGRILLLLIFFCILSVGRSTAQQALSVSAKTVGTPGIPPAKIYQAGVNEPPRAVEFSEGTITPAQFMANINEYLKIPAEFTFLESESNTDQLGMRHRRLQQYYKGIPLEGMSYRVHEKSGFVISANGRTVRNLNLYATQTTLSEQQAFNFAKTYLQTKDTIVRKGTKLIVSKDFSYAPESFAIAFQFDIDVSLIERWRISIDAATGQIINKVSLVNSCANEPTPTPPLPYGTGTGQTNYYGSQTIRVEQQGNGSRLIGQTQHGGSIGTYDYKNASVLALTFGIYNLFYDFYSPDNTYTTAYQKPAVSVQWAAEHAYEYYYNKHNRNSFDNNGGAIKSYVHVDVKMDNAYWTGKVLAFGDGSANNPLVELDIVSHELTHGVTQYEAGLQNIYEPGALNESFSDIMGKAVEFYTFGDSASWQMGKHYLDGGLRDFSNPNRTNQPDTYAGDLWYTGSDDNGGTHTNMGVQNFWFYLLCKGGTGVNDHGFSYSVSPIGMDAAINITYRNLTEYLTSTSDYLDSRIGAMLAAADLYGKNSTVYQQVDNAWDAVGVIDEPIVTGLEAYDITGTTVKLRGSMLPRADAASYHFEYGTTPAFGSTSAEYQYSDKVQGIVTGLQSKTKYYLRLAATNEHGTSYGATITFTTLPLTPLVKIKNTTDITETTAVLYGLVNPNSLPTTFHFEYGLTPAMESVTPSQTLPDTTEFLNTSASVTGLQALKTYYYKIVAANASGTASSETATFFTSVKPVILSFTPTVAPAGAEITITGLGFNPVPEKNLVSFGATRGTVVASSLTQIKVQVPSGASLGSITVLDTESGLYAESAQEFTPTFTGEYKKGAMQLKVGYTDYLYQVFVEDMDGDGKPDIVARQSGGFAVFQNVNQGGDITSDSFIRNSFNSTTTPSSLALVDFDGNGLKDVIVSYSNLLRIYPNFSVAGFMFLSTPVEIPTKGILSYMIFDDFDTDGHIDIAGMLGLNFTIIRNQNPRKILSADNFTQTYSKTLTHDVWFSSTGDLNNDGTPDVMLSSWNGNSLYVLKNNSYPGTFDFSESTIPDPTRGRFANYIAHDLNQDNRKDIISNAPSLDGNLAVWQNNSKSTDITLATPVIAWSNNTQADTEVADMNGDGKPDLVVSTSLRTFMLIENKNTAGQPFLNASFENADTYGLPIVNEGSGRVETKMAVNDLNGDGRPDVIATYYYNYGPHDGYQMEIWQNSSTPCMDLSLIKVNASDNKATIVLPPNTTIDQFEIQYTPVGYNYWITAYSTTLDYLTVGQQYQIKVRAKCGLSFTDYYYLNFTTDCVSLSYFQISTGTDNAQITTNYAISNYDIQYSPAGKDQWTQVSDAKITSLTPGTTYDLRYRGRCATLAGYRYTQFTTICTSLPTIKLSNLTYKSVTLNVGAYGYKENIILEYSKDQINWNAVDPTWTIYPLTPGQSYYIRGRFSCSNTYATTSFTTPCPDISSLYVSDITSFGARINWTDDSKTGSYALIYGATGSPGIYEETSSPFFTLTGLTPGTSYTVSVAVRCIGDPKFSEVKLNTICYSPSNLSVDTVTYTTATLSWTESFTGQPYYVDYAIKGTNNWLTTQTSASSVKLNELRPGVEYEVKVHIDCTSEKPPYLYTTFNTDIYKETAFFPNPTNDRITIQPSTDLIGIPFNLYDNMGRTVASGSLTEYTLDLSGFAPGVYTLKIKGENVMRIVKR